MDVSLRTQPNYLEGLWAGLYVTPTFHDETEEAWCSRPLVPVAGSFFPPVFRLNLAAWEGSDIDACTVLKVENGTFVSPNGMPLLGVQNVADHGRVLTDLMPRLTQALTMVPNLITVTADGSWRWKPLGWAPGSGPQDQAAYEEWKRKIKAQKLIFPWINEQFLLEERLPQRMSNRWHSYYLPRIEVVARCVQEAKDENDTVTSGILNACDILQAGESTARWLLAQAREIGLAPYGEAQAPDVPWWMYEENSEEVIKQAESGDLSSRATPSLKPIT
ncbi:hypothetical protein [Streptomyces sp. TN58]|uniref:hypothetical protein n=1 Tax=Streptomyces sp. TN58 TaxID=234612 RepID=UPI0018FE9102|nr:hypothetical protein [Streptomyces sp. TN58]